MQGKEQSETSELRDPEEALEVCFRVKGPRGGIRGVFQSKGTQRRDQRSVSELRDPEEALEGCFRVKGPRGGIRGVFPS
jgi:hypothetical protein